MTASRAGLAKLIDQSIDANGREYHWEPVATEDFHSTAGRPGSQEKIEAMRERMEAGFPLWHPQDPKDFEAEELSARAMKRGSRRRKG